MVKYLIWRDITLPKVNKQRANFEQRMDVFILPSFCDQCHGFGIKASYSLT